MRGIVIAIVIGYVEEGEGETIYEDRKKEPLLGWQLLYITTTITTTAITILEYNYDIIYIKNRRCKLEQVVVPL